MKVLRITFWGDGKPWVIRMNAEGRLSVTLPTGNKFDRLTIEEDNPTSKVRFTEDGAHYSPWGFDDA